MLNMLNKMLILSEEKWQIEKSNYQNLHFFVNSLII